MWGIYIVVFLAIIFVLSILSQVYLGKFWPGMLVGIVIFYPIYRLFVKYLRRRQGI